MQTDIIKRIDFRKQISSPLLLSVVKELSEINEEKMTESVYRLLEMGAKNYIEVKNLTKYIINHTSP
jgi:hypothetical protein